MKNIHVLPTDKPSIPSRLFYKEQELVFSKKYSVFNGVNIYITSDEEIKKNDWVLFKFNEATEIVRVTTINSNAFETKQGFGYGLEYCKKIILTTDQGLDGVQTIDDEFLEWFVKNPSCEFAHLGFTSIIGDLETKRTYKIIIPKEEHCICEVGHPYNNAACKIHGGSRKEKYKQELPQLGTKEFNDLASAYFGGKPKQENCCTPIGQIKRYKDCIGCDKKPSKLDLTQLNKDVDDVLDKETKESMSQWLKEKRQQETLEEKLLSWDELVKEAGSEEELLKILKLPHIAPLVREAIKNNFTK